MKFFFPDSHDHVDPTFDFVAETSNPHRIPQRDDLYAHEIFDSPPYDGVLVSKGIVDGLPGAAQAKYSLGQRRRFTSVGGRAFLRLPQDVALMGDCGAFTYRSEVEPPYTVDEVIDFYDVAGADYGVSVDHVILAHNPELLRRHADAAEFVRRQDLTLDLAEQFLKEHRRRRSRFTPLGVAQGWSPDSYAYAVRSLQKIGYTYIAVGGMVPLKTPQILATLAAIDEVRKPVVALHLLGITRLEQLATFRSMGAVSFDSTSPLMQGLKDDDDNFWMLDGNYGAIAVPDPETNNRMKRLISSGQVNGDDAVRLARAAFEAVLLFDRGELVVDAVVDRIWAYEQLDPRRKDRRAEYARALRDQPWRRCGCPICSKLGVHVILKRAAARNRRRGFHNLHIFSQKLRVANGIQIAA